MLSLYLDIFIIGHNFYNMISILNELTIRKNLQNVVTNNVFWTKKSKTAEITVYDKMKNLTMCELLSL